jgi:hypothetical protein
VLADKVKGLENLIKKGTLAGAEREAELHNLKSAVAKIPKEVWDMHTKKEGVKSLER